MSPSGVRLGPVSVSARSHWLAHLELEADLVQLESLPNAEVELAACFAWLTTEDDPVVAAQQHPGCSHPKTNAHRFAEIGKREVTDSLKYVADIGEDDAVDDADERLAVRC